MVSVSNDLAYSVGSRPRLRISNRTVRVHRYIPVTDGNTDNGGINGEASAKGVYGIRSIAMGAPGTLVVAGDTNGGVSGTREDGVPRHPSIIAG